MKVYIIYYIHAQILALADTLFVATVFGFIVVNLVHFKEGKP